MLDSWVVPKLAAPLRSLALKLQKQGTKPDQVTLAGFVIGMLSVPALAAEFYWLALLLIILNRVCDGLDGALARLVGPTDGGGYLDITLDFIFYASVVFGFALASPTENALAAAALITSFMGTGASFLAFAIMAQKRNIENIRLPNKGLYYINGLAEGTETIAFLIAFCLFPTWFPSLAYAFCAICVITTATRVYGGYTTLRDTCWKEKTLR